MESHEIFRKIVDSYTDFYEQHNLFEEKGKGSAAAKARKSIQEVKKLISEYRKLNMNDVKTIKNNKKEEKSNG